eukprot:5322060-Prymnesium_polylepis.1
MGVCLCTRFTRAACAARGAHRAVRAGMVEVARRLLLEGRSSEPHPPERAATFAQAAAYLTGRLQGTPEQKPGREPDMSAEAADAMKEALRHLGAVHGEGVQASAPADGQTAQDEHPAADSAIVKAVSGGAEIWDALRTLATRVAPSAAAHHGRAPRLEAAWRLIGNREAVLRDVANPSADKNIVGKPLTQLELKRVPVQHAAHADEALRETVRRLTAEREPPRPEQPEVWAQMAEYLNG